MPKRLDLTGMTFGNLTVLSKSGPTSRGEILWNCGCSCGARTKIRAGHLVRGNSKSCGCEQLKAVTFHGMTGTPIFRSWESMKSRCLNPNDPSYDRYGGRGIKVCKSWTSSFESFYADMGSRPKGKSLDRVDNSRNYTPKNCKWSTPKEQAANRRSTRFLTYKGKSHALAVLAEKFGISNARLIWRLDAGWSAEKALQTPIRIKRQSTKGTLQ